ncbi:Uncharacterised protein [Vibrio cholerae]|nr:Uncharacterised protein [Vibrio cholerae]
MASRPLSLNCLILCSQMSLALAKKISSNWR